MSNMQFTPQQEAAIRHRSGDLLVSAAAGSGKTRVLVERLMEQVEAGSDVNRFLIITYTRAAAAELRGRILDEINRRLAQSPSRHLRRQSALVYAADIGTIHAFCAKIIRGFAHVLEANPEFRVADESEATLLLRTALEDTLEARYGDADSHPGFLALVDTVSEGRGDELLMQTVLDLHKKLLSHPYPQKWAEDRRADMSVQNLEDAAETIWGAYLLNETRSAMDYWLREMASAREEMQDDPVFLKAYGNSWDETLASLARFVVGAKQGWDPAFAAIPIPFPRAGAVRGKDLLHEKWKDLRRRCKNAVEKLSEAFTLSSEDILDDIRAAAPVLSALLALTLDVDAAYRAEKTRRGILDFSDLEHLAIKLLVNPQTGGPTQTAQELAQTYEEVMVDEFQDVSPIQDMLFSALGEYGLRRFLVGDLKQSIYRFRLADPGIFLKLYRRFPDIGESETPGGKTALLGKNFRSRPAILDAVNFIFRRIMSESFGEMDYGDREALYPGLSEAEENTPAISLDVLDLKPLPKDGSDRREMQEARHVAAEIRKLHDEEGYTWGDFAILLRSVSGKAGRYEKALEELDIPVAKSGRSAFFYTPEVAAFLSLIRVILNPRQDVSLISAMRSPLFCFTPDELAEIRLSGENLSFYEALEQHAKQDKKCADFLQKLEHYRNAAPDMSVDQFLWYLLSETSALSIYAAMPNGEIRRAHLLALLAWAKGAGSAGYRSLFDFISLVEKREQSDRAPEIPSPHGGDAVTIMSIHKSKGLEFPVVVLPNLAKDFNLQDLRRQILVHPQLGLGAVFRDLNRKIRYSTLPRQAIAKKLRQETLAEELRVLYVAMTRAEKRLLMTITLPDAEKTLDSLALTAGDPISPHTLEAASGMAPWILLPAMTRPEAETLRGEHVVPLAETAHPWKIRKITCNPEEASPRPAAEKPKISPNPTPPQTVLPDPEFVRQLNYTYAYPQAVDLPGKLTATQQKGRSLDLEVQDESIPLPKRTTPPPIFRRPLFLQGKRPLTGAERGIATHLVMQYINFALCTSLSGIEGEITRLVREARITKETAQAVDAQAIFRFFESPLGKRVLSAKDLKREFKFSLLAPASDFYPVTEDEQILLQGVLDCYFQDPEGLITIDFKTDYIPPGGLLKKAQEYKGQMDTYAYALTRITGQPVKESHLYFLGPGESVCLDPPP